MYTMDRKSEFLIISAIMTIHNFFKRPGCDKWKQFVSVIESIVFQVTMKNPLQGVYSAFNKWSFSVCYCGVNFYFIKFTIFLNSLAKLELLLTPTFFAGSYFVIVGKKTQNTDLESFIFFRFASVVLSNESWRTEKSFHCFFSSLVYQFSKDPSTNSFLDPAKAFLHLNSHAAGVKSVKEAFD